MSHSPDSLSNVDVLCNAVMRGVVASGALDGSRLDNAALDRAIAIMRAEINALLFGDKYADERDCILRGSVSQSVVVMSVVASCVNKIRA